MKRVTAVTPTKLTVAGLAVESTAPSTAIIEVVGFYQQGSVKATFTEAGNVVTLTFDGGTVGDANALSPGEIIFIGSDTDANNFQKSTTPVNIGFARVGSVSATGVVLDWTTFDPEDISGNTASVEIYIPTRSFSDKVTFKELRKTTFTIERILGYHDEEQDSSTEYPTPQSEVLKGAYADQLEITIPDADLIKVTGSFMARGYAERTGAKVGLVKPSDPASPPLSYSGTNDLAEPIDISEAYNSTWDMVHNSLYLHRPGSTNRAKLFAYGIDGTISLQNNLAAKTGYGTFGPIVVTSGDFVVNITLNVLFTDIAVQSAIARGDSVGLYFVLARENAGVVIDLPNLTIASGALTVATGEPVMIALTNEANRSKFGHAAMICYYNYLPAIAYAGDRSVC